MMAEYDTEVWWRGMVPLVLHKIVSRTTVAWEDVHEREFRKMLDFIGQRYAVFTSNASTRDARWMLTFDDGNASDYDITFRLLAEKHIQATFFLIVDKIGTTGHLDWSQIKEMHRHGMCIGSHSLSHRRLTTLSAQEAAQEFQESKRRLEDSLGAPVEAFSYPFGDCTSQLHQFAFAAGYRYVCTSNHGIAGASRRVIPRNAIHSAMKWNDIVRTLEPTSGTRVRWLLEDKIKHALKGAIGRDQYNKWRNRAFGES